MLAFPRTAFRTPLSHQSAFTEGYTAIVSDDEMIEHADVDQRQCGAQAAGDGFVGRTWLCDA
jgi:hypothetical protein